MPKFNHNLPLSAPVANRFRQWMLGMCKAFFIHDDAIEQKIKTCRTGRDAVVLIHALRRSPVLRRANRLQNHKLLLLYSMSDGCEGKNIKRVTVSFCLKHSGAPKPDLHMAFLATEYTVRLEMPGGVISHGGEHARSRYRKNGFRDEMGNLPAEMQKALLMVYRQALNGFHYLKGGNNSAPIWQHMLDEVKTLQNPMLGRLCPELVPNLPALFSIMDKVYGGENLARGPLAARYDSIRHMVEGCAGVTALRLLEIMDLEDELRQVLLLKCDGCHVSALGAKAIIRDHEQQPLDAIIFMVERGYGAGTCTLLRHDYFQVSSMARQHATFKPRKIQRLCKNPEAAEVMCLVLTAFTAYVWHDKALRQRCREAALFLSAQEETPSAS